MEQIFDLLISSFDFTYCLTVNLLTYMLIRFIDRPISIWAKRGVLLFSIAIITLIYYFTGSELRLLVNSAILAPVSWSWIFKPMCKKLNIDYPQI